MITIDIADYKVFAAISGDKTNAQLTALLEDSAKIVEGYLGVTYEAPLPDDVITLLSDRVEYYLDYPAQLDTVTHIDRITGDTTLLSEGSEYIVYDGKLRLMSTAFSSFDTLSLGYNGASLTAPEDIKMAVMLLTQYYYKQDYSRVSSQVAGQSSRNADSNESTSLPNRVRAILDFHRIL